MESQELQSGHIDFIYVLQLGEFLCFFQDEIMQNQR